MSTALKASFARSAQSVKTSWVQFFGASVCFLIFGAKVALIARVNINWDEFFYLSHVHEYVRGELARPFQMAHVHLFAWLPKTSPHEVEQILAGRVVMTALLGVTAVLIFRLASQWVSPHTAWLAPVCFLAASPILRHGGAFRADSLLAPLLLGSLILVTTRRHGKRNAVAAGLLLGAAGAIAVKAVLSVPVLTLLALVNRDGDGADTLGQRLRAGAKRVTIIGVVSIVLAAVLVALHQANLAQNPSKNLASFAVGVADKTLLSVPWFPRTDYLQPILLENWAVWLLILGGTLAAVVRRSSAGICAIALLPIVFYRNAFPYYYLVMLAPAAVLAALCADTLRLTVARVSGNASSWVPVLVAIPVLLQFGVNFSYLRYDGLERQRTLISAVHQIFPNPVPYIDHSGMVSSFPKANFFMSSWGLENYRKNGVGFMRDAISHERPPALITNTSVLDPTSAASSVLTEEDRSLIEQFYIEYWGPIRVAGARIDLDSFQVAEVALPFPGRYRLEASQPVDGNGQRLFNGAVIEVRDEEPFSVRLVSSGSGVTTVRMLWAEARPPPEWTWPYFNVYTGL
jgi:hypothetical protein